MDRDRRRDRQPHTKSNKGTIHVNRTMSVSLPVVRKIGNLRFSGKSPAADVPVCVNVRIFAWIHPIQRMSFWLEGPYLSD